jgi:hypothetical protein
LTTLVQNFTALKNNSNKCDQDQDQDLKQCKKNDLQYGFIIVLLSFYLYLLNQPLPEPKKSNGTDGTFNITLRPYSFNIPGKIKVIEKVIINTQNSTLFTVPAGKRFLLYSVMEINTSTTTTSLNTISALSFKLDQTIVQPNSAYTVNVTLVFEEGESLLWQATTVPTSAQIIKVFYVELNQSDNIPLFSFKKFVTSIAPISTLMQAASSGPAIIISGYNGFEYLNYNNTTSPTTSTIYSCSVNDPFTFQNYTANIYIDNFKVGQSGFFVIDDTVNIPSPSSASIHSLNYGLNGIGFVISPNSTVQVGPVSGGPSGIFVYGTYYQF